VREEKVVIRMTAVLEKVEARRYESVKMLPGLKQESSCGSGHPISGD
jgi:hypothetical protein